MPNQRQPIELVVAKGKKHLTKAEIEKRKCSEVKPLTDNIEPPEYLLKKQKDKFNEIANQLKELGVLSETDVDALARYVISNELYIKLTKQMLRHTSDPVVLDTYMKNQSKAFNQCRESANDLGLTITSRCKLVVPKGAETEEKQNKFAKFVK